VLVFSQEVVWFERGSRHSTQRPCTNKTPRGKHQQSPRRCPVFIFYIHPAAAGGSSWVKLTPWTILMSSHPSCCGDLRASVAFGLRWCYARRNSEIGRAVPKPFWGDIISEKNSIGNLDEFCKLTILVRARKYNL
jgi:hypothetical protein